MRKLIDTDPAKDGLIRRYAWKVDYLDLFDDYDSDADQVCIDRLTGREIVRYDLGDPANYAPSHGGWSKNEYLERKGCNPDEEILLSQVAPGVEVDSYEVERNARAKELRAQREKEEAEAQDVLLFLGDEADAFSFKDWQEGEEKIITPALERRGYSDICYYMIEDDSFGPLIRGIVAYDSEGKKVRFFYG